LLSGPIVVLSQRGTHAELGGFCQKLGLPPPDFEGSKRERMQHSFDAANENHLPSIATNFLAAFPPALAFRNQIEDIIWETPETPDIPKRFRYELSRKLGGASDLFHRRQAFEKLLDRLWILDDPFNVFLNRTVDLRTEIHECVFQRPDMWPAELLFQKVGAFDAPNPRFIRFIEGLASGEVRPDVWPQLQFVTVVNEALRPCGVALAETGVEQGYPKYEIVWFSKTVNGRPKNIIFASSTKPDLRFRDAINNDVEIGSNADDVLIYDLPIPTGGLLWNDLQSWWAEKQKVSAVEAKRTLYNRLLVCLPQTSPSQRLLFTAYAKHFGTAIPKLPALLPEVWLHWDPKTVRERGQNALLRFRMDFLMLLPNGVRVVIEVDGKHHYSDEQGRGSPSKYSAMMEADRELRLAGYEVHRFGAEELREGSEPLVGVFFERLFKLHRVALPVPKKVQSA
jgi:very-short-patch-repair endonuclease